MVSVIHRQSHSRNPPWACCSEQGFELHSPTTDPERWALATKGEHQMSKYQNPKGILKSC
jgi:hypothetical protein